MEYSEYQINSKIKFLAKIRGITIKLLAEKINMTESGLYSTLKNNSIKVKTLHDISTVLDVELTYFLNPTQNSGELFKDFEAKKDALLPLLIKKDGVLEILNQSKGFTEAEAGLISEIFNLVRIIQEKEEENEKLIEKDLLYKKFEKFYEHNTDMLISAIGSILIDVYFIGKKNNIDLENQIKKTYGYKTLSSFLKHFGKDIKEASEKRNEAIKQKNKGK